MKLEIILVIAVAVALGRFISVRYFAPTPKEEVIKRTTTGDPVRDFMDNF